MQYKLSLPEAFKLKTAEAKKGRDCLISGWPSTAASQEICRLCVLYPGFTDNGDTENNSSSMLFEQ